MISEHDDKFIWRLKNATDWAVANNKSWSTLNTNTHIIVLKKDAYKQLDLEASIFINSHALYFINQIEYNELDEQEQKKWHIINFDSQYFDVCKFPEKVQDFIFILNKLNEQYGEELYFLTNYFNENDEWELEIIPTIKYKESRKERTKRILDDYISFKRVLTTQFEKLYDNNETASIYTW